MASCSANVEWAIGRLKYAEGVMYRKNLFDEAIAAAEKEMAKITDAEKENPAVQAEIKRFQDMLTSLKIKFEERERKEAYEELERKVRAKWQEMNNNWPRFPDRVETALNDLRKA
jgi:hypothetical protein